MYMYCKMDVWSIMLSWNIPLVKDREGGNSCTDYSEQVLYYWCSKGLWFIEVYHLTFCQVTISLSLLSCNSVCTYTHTHTHLHVYVRVYVLL